MDRSIGDQFADSQFGVHRDRLAKGFSDNLVYRQHLFEETNQTFKTRGIAFFADPNGNRIGLWAAQ